MPSLMIILDLVLIFPMDILLLAIVLKNNVVHTTFDTLLKIYLQAQNCSAKLSLVGSRCVNRGEDIEV